MYLFFDTETTGLPLSWKAPVSDINNWPRMVQIAWMLYDKNGKEIEVRNHIVKPENFVIPHEASLIHGITNEIAEREGSELISILNEFHSLLSDSQYLVAHNISFDEKIVGAEFIRKEIENIIEKRQKICTMRESTNFCAIKGKYGNKWPTLSELHYKLFGEYFDDAHNAEADIRVTAKCFWELRSRGQLL